MSTSREQILTFLVKPQNLQTAYEVTEWLPDAEKAIYETFWAAVGDRLKKRLADGGHDAQWRIYKLELNYLCIVPLRAEDEDWAWYMVAAEALNDDCYFGVWRGSGQSAKENSNLDQALKADKFRAPTRNGVDIETSG